MLQAQWEEIRSTSCKKLRETDKWRLSMRDKHVPNNNKPDLEFVKKFTRPNFRAKEFYTLKTRKSRLLLLAINSKNASLSVI